MREWLGSDDRDMCTYFVCAMRGLCAKSSLGPQLEKLSAGVSETPGYRPRRPKDGEVAQGIAINFAYEDPEVRAMYLELMADHWKIGVSETVDRVRTVLARMAPKHRMVLCLQYGDNDHNIQQKMGGCSLSLCEATKAVVDTHAKAAKMYREQGQKFDLSTRSFLLWAVGQSRRVQEAKDYLDAIIGEAQVDLKKAQQAYLRARENVKC